MTEDTRTDGHVGRHGTAVVNGPEDDDLDWLSIDWQRVEADVRRLRQRIFTSLLEPGAVKAARRVLRGSRGSNAPGLPDHGGRLPRLQSIREPLSAAGAVGAADRTRVGDQAHPLGRRTTRQNDGGRTPKGSAERIRHLRVRSRSASTPGT
jgi:hypothetical protein